MRFPEFKGEWEKCKLEECVVFLDGKRKPIKSSERVSEQKLYPYYGASGIIDYIDDYLFDGKFILLSEDGANILDRNYRVAFIAEGKIWVNNHAHVLQSNDNIDINFIAEKLESLDYSIYNTGTTMPKLNQEVCRNIPLWLPPTEEQVKIGTLLSLLNERITTQSKIIEKYESLIKGIRYYILEESTHYNCLGNLCDIIKGQQVNLDNLLKHGKYYVMNGGTQPSGYYNSYNTNAGTISISEGGNSCGYVQYNKENFWSGGHCYTLQNIKGELTEKYLYHYLKSNEKMIMALRVGSGLPNIQKKDLMSLRIPIPAKENQKKISCLLDSIEDKISVETNVMTKFMQQKQYLLANLFI